MKRLIPILAIIFCALQSNAQSQLNLVYNWQDSSLVASSVWGNVYNEIWGFVQGGKEYAVIGTTDGTHIFDLSDKNNIYMAAYIAGKYQGSNVIHRDYHDYNGYLYIVCDEGNSSLQIVDLSQLPNSAPVVYDDDVLFRRAHNIFIDSDAGIMYKCGGEDQLNLYSLADPENPTLLVDCPADVSFWSGIGYLHDIYVENGIAYCNAGGRGLFIVDFSDYQNPELLGSLTQYPDQGYNHSGWLHPKGNYYIMADETHGMDMKLLDVSDPSDITVVSQINSNVDPLSVAHNQIIHDDLLYVAYYYDGVYVYDIAVPESPQLLATYPTSSISHRNSFEGAWGVYPLLPSGLLLASDMQTGLYVFDNIPVSVESKSKSTLQFFPNPAKDFIIIENEESFEAIRVKDISGRSVVTKPLLKGKNVLNLRKYDLSTGIFVLEFIGKNYTKTEKLIIH